MNSTKKPPFPRWDGGFFFVVLLSFTRDFAIYSPRFASSRLDSIALLANSSGSAPPRALLAAGAFASQGSRILAFEKYCANRMQQGLQGAVNS